MTWQFRLPALLLVLCIASSAGAGSPRLQMKYDYAAGVLNDSASSRRIDSGNNTEAKAKLAEAREKLNTAHYAIDAGDDTAAEKLINEALRIKMAATRMAPNQPANRHLLQKRFNDTLQQVNTYLAWTMGYRANNPASEHPIDVAQIHHEIREAQAAAASGNLEQANKILTPLLANLLKQTDAMIGKQTLTYDQNFATLKDEHEYELARSEEYKRLVPKAIEQRLPSAGIRNLVNRFITKGDQLQEEARIKAEGGDYPSAITLLQNASKEYQRAIQTLGVR